MHVVAQHNEQSIWLIDIVRIMGISNKNSDVLFVFKKVKTNINISAASNDSKLREKLL